MYSYVDSWLSDEIEVDQTGELSLKKGDIVARRHRTWIVDSIHLEQDIVGDWKRAPTLWVLLVEARVN